MSEKPPKRPPPPPPPPPPPSKVNPHRVRTRTKGGTGGLTKAAVAIVFGAAAVTYYSKDKAGSPFQELSSSLPSFKSAPEKKKDILKEYLQEEAKSDDTVSSFLNKKQSNITEKKGSDFRLDVSKEGLIKTFNFLLETKRMEEASLIKQVRQRRAPRDYVDTLKRMKQEKQEMKDILKRLKKKY